MSIEYSTKVWAIKGITPTDKLVLLCIADFANERGEAWPSVATIVENTGLVERTVQTSIKRLKASQNLEIKAGAGRKNTNLYIIKNPAADAPRSRCTPHLTTETPHLTALNPAADAPNPSGTTKEPSIDNICAKKALFGFDEFWDAYGHKKARPKCESIWKRKRLANISQQVIEGAKRYAQSRGDEPQYWKHPQGWLNDGRWLDEVAQPKDSNAVPQNETPAQRMQREVQEYFKDEHSTIDLQANVIPLHKSIAGH